MILVVVIAGRRSGRGRSSSGPSSARAELIVPAAGRGVPLPSRKKSY